MKNGHIVISDEGKNKTAVLKLYRVQDSCELSIRFDNSLGAFGEKLSRVHVAVFPSADAKDAESLIDYNVDDAQDLSVLISEFVYGILSIPAHADPCENNCDHCQSGACGSPE